MHSTKESKDALSKMQGSTDNILKKVEEKVVTKYYLGESTPNIILSVQLSAEINEETLQYLGGSQFITKQIREKFIAHSTEELNQERSYHKRAITFFSKRTNLVMGITCVFIDEVKSSNLSIREYGQYVVKQMLRKSSWTEMCTIMAYAFDTNVHWLAFGVRHTSKVVDQQLKKRAIREALRDVLMTLQDQMLLDYMTLGAQEVYDNRYSFYILNEIFHSITATYANSKARGEQFKESLDINPVTQMCIANGKRKAPKKGTFRTINTTALRSRMRGELKNLKEKKIENQLSNCASRRRETTEGISGIMSQAHQIDWAKSTVSHDMSAEAYNLLINEMDEMLALNACPATLMAYTHRRYGLVHGKAANVRDALMGTTAKHIVPALLALRSGQSSTICNEQILTTPIDYIANADISFPGSPFSEGLIKNPGEDLVLRTFFGDSAHELNLTRNPKGVAFTHWNALEDYVPHARSSYILSVFEEKAKAHGSNSSPVAMTTHSRVTILNPELYQAVSTLGALSSAHSDLETTMIFDDPKYTNGKDPFDVTPIVGSSYRTKVASEGTPSPVVTSEVMTNAHNVTAHYDTFGEEYYLTLDAVRFVVAVPCTQEDRDTVDFLFPNLLAIANKRVKHMRVPNVTFRNKMLDELKLYPQSILLDVCDTHITKLRATERNSLTAQELAKLDEEISNVIDARKVVSTYAPLSTLEEKKMVIAWASIHYQETFFNEGLMSQQGINLFYTKVEKAASYLVAIALFSAVRSSLGIRGNFKQYVTTMDSSGTTTRQVQRSLKKVKVINWDHFKYNNMHKYPKSLTMLPTQILSVIGKHHLFAVTAPLGSFVASNVKYDFDSRMIPNVVTIIDATPLDATRKARGLYARSSYNRERTSMNDLAALSYETQSFVTNRTARGTCSVLPGYGVFQYFVCERYAKSRQINQSAVELLSHKQRYAESLIFSGLDQVTRFDLWEHAPAMWREDVNLFTGKTLFFHGAARKGLVSTNRKQKALSGASYAHLVEKSKDPMVFMSKVTEVITAHVDNARLHKFEYFEEIVSKRITHQTISKYDELHDSVRSEVVNLAILLSNYRSPAAVILQVTAACKAFVASGAPGEIEDNVHVTKSAIMSLNDLSNAYFRTAKKLADSKVVRGALNFEEFSPEKRLVIAAYTAILRTSPHLMGIIETILRREAEHTYSAAMDKAPAYVKAGFTSKRDYEDSLYEKEQLEAIAKLNDKKKEEKCNAPATEKKQASVELSLIDQMKLAELKEDQETNLINGVGALPEYDINAPYLDNESDAKVAKDLRFFTNDAPIDASNIQEAVTKAIRAGDISSARATKFIETLNN